MLKWEQVAANPTMPVWAIFVLMAAVALFAVLMCCEPKRKRS